MVDGATRLSKIYTRSTDQLAKNKQPNQCAKRDQWDREAQPKEYLEVRDFLGVAGAVGRGKVFSQWLRERREVFVMREPNARQ